MDDINEQIDTANEISQVLSSSMSSSLDEDDLESELLELQEQQIMDEILHAPVLASARATPKSVVNEDKELKELEMSMSSSPPKMEKKPIAVAVNPTPFPSTTMQKHLFNPNEATFNKLVSLQTASGPWMLSEQLGALGLNIEEIRKLDFQNNISEQAKATLIVIALLETYFARYKEDFELLKLKSILWLESTYSKVDEMRAIARSVLPSIIYQ